MENSFFGEEVKELGADAKSLCRPTMIACEAANTVGFRRWSLREGSMKGNPRVLDQLNQALKDELTAINQYFLHAEMAENWGYKKYSKYIKRQSIDEMKHAELLMERILFLDGIPKMEPMSLTIGKSVKEMIESDLGLEHEAVVSYNESIKVCVENGDNGSRDLFVKLLRDEEGHVDWLESQVHQIKEIGYERYLITQTEED